MSEKSSRGGVWEKEAYGPSVHVKTWEKPQDRTWASDSLREGVGAIVWFLLEGSRSWGGGLIVVVIGPKVVGQSFDRNCRF